MSKSSHHPSETNVKSFEVFKNALKIFRRTIKKNNHEEYLSILDHLNDNDIMVFLTKEFANSSSNEKIVKVFKNLLNHHPQKEKHLIVQQAFQEVFFKKCHRQDLPEDMWDLFNKTNPSAHQKLSVISSLISRKINNPAIKNLNKIDIRDVYFVQSQLARSIYFEDVIPSHFLTLVNDIQLSHHVDDIVRSALSVIDNDPKDKNVSPQFNQRMVRFLDQLEKHKENLQDHQRIVSLYTALISSKYDHCRSHKLFSSTVVPPEVITIAQAYKQDEKCFEGFGDLDINSKLAVVSSHLREIVTNYNNANNCIDDGVDHSKIDFLKKLLSTVHPNEREKFCCNVIGSNLNIWEHAWHGKEGGEGEESNIFLDLFNEYYSCVKSVSLKQEILISALYAHKTVVLDSVFNDLSIHDLNKIYKILIYMGENQQHQDTSSHKEYFVNLFNNRMKAELEANLQEAQHNLQRKVGQPKKM